MSIYYEPSIVPGPKEPKPHLSCFLPLSRNWYGHLIDTYAEIIVPE